MALLLAACDIYKWLGSTLNRGWGIRLITDSSKDFDVDDVRKVIQLARSTFLNQVSLAVIRGSFAFESSKGTKSSVRSSGRQSVANVKIYSNG